VFVEKLSGNREYRFRIERFVRFVRFLVTIGVLPRAPRAITGNKADDLTAFRDWLRRHRGISEQTLLDRIRGSHC
jgi:hypothetical protein